MKKAKKKALICSYFGVYARYSPGIMIAIMVSLTWLFLETVLLLPFTVSNIKNDTSEPVDWWSLSWFASIVLKFVGNVDDLMPFSFSIK